jgi:type I restriction enzyme R subunit
LKAAGWDLRDKTQVVEEFYIDLKTGVEEPRENYAHQFSDYVLFGNDGKIIAVIEAKKTSLDATAGKEQAKQYCLHIQKKQNGFLPFCFFTNGHDIYFWDLGNYPPKKAYGFPTKDDFARLLFLRNARKPLAEELINTRIAGRDYQIRAIRSVMEAVEKRKNKFLLVMATGTGKTRTVIALVDALMRAGWCERILFLVDRIALQHQTLDAFKENLPNEPRWPNSDERKIAADRRIYVSTYPAMLNIIRGYAALSPHFFDLIVVDESHRSIYNTYKEILDYFNTITLGLTATPTDIIDHNTFQIFNCEDGLPTFAYSYEEAVNNRYLSDFNVLAFKTKFQEQGISKRTISLEDQLRLVHEGNDIEEIDFEGTDLEKTVVNQGTNSLIVREFMEHSIKDSNGVLPGKTIFFCMSIAHARRIEEIFNSLYPEYHGEIAKVLVSQDSRVHGKGGLLDQFTNSNMPRVAISVDMLDTGIDVREVVNLVFAKQVYSYTKFWQMIGRGTRLLEPEKMQPWCLEKSSFQILDFWDNVSYFKLNPKGKAVNRQIPLPVRLFGLRLDKIEKAKELNRADIVSGEIHKARKLLQLLPSNSIVVLDAQADLKELNDESFWNELTSYKIDFLRKNIKPLLRSIANVDFKAMRFEKDIVEVSIAHLQSEKEKFDALQQSIVEEISELPLEVNTVAQHEELIRKSQTNQFWSTISEAKFDLLTEKLGPLMCYIDHRRGGGQSNLNLKDIVSRRENVEFGPEHESVSITRYKEMVERKIIELTNRNPILQKVLNGQVITNKEAEQLGDELYHEHPHITIDLLRKVYQHQKAQLIQFIKHILGIEPLESFPQTVAKSFDQFISEHAYLNIQQLDFLNLLKMFLIEKGDVEKKDLITAPFTRVHPNGILGVFSRAEIDEIISFIQKLAA